MTKKVLRGGSWYWPSEHLRSSRRRLESVARDVGHRFSARCATEQPFLTRFPPRHVTLDRPLPEAPDAPSAEQLRAANDFTRDDVMAIPNCATRDHSTTTCKDPTHYVTYNEHQHWLFAPYLRGLGGGYVGVASDGNYSLAAAARSEWVWLVDYDPVVTWLHRMLSVLVQESETPEAFVARWTADARPATRALLAARLAGSSRLDEWLLRIVDQRGKELEEHYRAQLAPDADHPGMGWLRDPASYAWMRRLMSQGRVVVAEGDFLGTKTLRGVAEAARRLDVPIRVFYLSNVTQFWPYSTNYRESVRAMPFDDWSVVLQTVSFAPTGWGEPVKPQPTNTRQPHYWHYNVTWGRAYQSKLALPGYDSIRTLLAEAVGTDHPQDLTILGLPSD